MVHVQSLFVWGFLMTHSVKHSDLPDFRQTCSCLEHLTLSSSGDSSVYSGSVAVRATTQIYWLGHVFPP